MAVFNYPTQDFIVSPDGLPQQYPQRTIDPNTSDDPYAQIVRSNLQLRSPQDMARMFSGLQQLASQQIQSPLQQMNQMSMGQTGSSSPFMQSPAQQGLQQNSPQMFQPQQNMQPQLPGIPSGTEMAMLGQNVQQPNSMQLQPQNQNPIQNAAFQSQQNPVDPSRYQQPQYNQLVDQLQQVFKSPEGQSVSKELGLTSLSKYKNIMDYSKLNVNIPITQDRTQRISNATQASVTSGGNPYVIAQSYLGTNEVDGRKTLGEFFRKSGGMSLDPQTTPWCAAYANAVLGAAGIKGTGQATARSFLHWGNPTDKPTQGDIVVFRRGNNPNQGHVAFYVGPGSKPGTIRVLGGNQGGRSQKGGGVTYEDKPISRVIGYRQPPQAKEFIPKTQPTGEGGENPPLISPETHDSVVHTLDQSGPAYE